MDSFAREILLRETCMYAFFRNISLRLFYMNLVNGAFNLSFSASAFTRLPQASLKPSQQHRLIKTLQYNYEAPGYIFCIRRSSMTLVYK